MAMGGLVTQMTVELAPMIETIATALEAMAIVAGEAFQVAADNVDVFRVALAAISPTAAGILSTLENSPFAGKVRARAEERALEREAKKNKAAQKAMGDDGASAKGDLEQTWDAADVLDFTGTIEAAKKKAVNEIKSEKMRVRTADEIISSLGLETKEDVQPKEHRFASAMLRGSSADYQARMMNRGNDPAAEAVKFQKEAVAEAKKQNQLLSDIDRKLPAVGVDVVEIA
jgi:hypothetical protein